ncbi:S-formylglutathione hydrolase [Jannaschia seohaensis]|uniref:S-formylglutathione hydrolase n=1 Tax=Jannaschia seohaensis TaxID=475081 RepID=A0A2Y9AZI6_9RHOB|nr:S-formylglutathione hydrolase [Jannaschia seohaensis]PWJ17446.1 S-formylglutathione hydrolase [Jannaschia seohaensis]SSA47509.1 S-formylglutathione hydrolase [Jannaschia seohaensis]
MKTLSESRCFGGTQGVYSHASEVTGTQMTFGLYMPPHPTGAVLWYLSGLTCTHENAMTKAGMQALAAEAGLAVVFPDTSPRGDAVADDDAFDLGQGAGFYVDATKGPWAQHFKMESYITEDLPETVFAAFDLDPERQAVTGHSMGGHGALTLAMKHQGRYRSVSAFAPICNPSVSDWGRPQLTAYTGTTEPHDATLLLEDRGLDAPLMIDTGLSDQFWDKLGTEAFLAALVRTRTPAEIGLRDGYDHSYFFVSSFAAAHVAFHAEHLA